MATNNATNNVPSVPISVANGGTGQTTLTNHGVLVGATTSAITQLSVGAANSILVGATSADPSFTTSGTVYVSGLSFDSGTNTLSNYASTTWTPTITGASTAGSTSYVGQNGYYTRVGNMVFVEGFCQISSATGTGDLTIGGLPFTIKSQTNGNPIGNLYFGGSASWPWPTGGTSLCIQGTNNTTTAVITVSGTLIAGGNMQMANAALSVYFSLTHQI